MRLEVSGEGLELSAEVVGRGRHQEAQEGQAAALVQAADDAEVEQRRAAIGQHEGKTDRGASQRLRERSNTDQAFSPADCLRELTRQRQRICCGFFELW